MYVLISEACCSTFKNSLYKVFLKYAVIKRENNISKVSIVIEQVRQKVHCTPKHEDRYVHVDTVLLNMFQMCYLHNSKTRNEMMNLRHGLLEQRTVPELQTHTLQPSVALNTSNWAYVKPLYKQAG